MQPVVERCHGTVVSRVGDELVSTFPDAVSAGWALGTEDSDAGLPSLSYRLSVAQPGQEESTFDAPMVT